MTRTRQPEIGVAVSTVILSLRDGKLALPLVRRTRDPYLGQWALPGGWLDAAEGFEDAAARTLASTTGLAPSYLEQLYAFGAVDRSDSRVVTIAYWALVRQATPTPENVEWFDAGELPTLAFDHNQIVDYALWRLRNKVGYSRVALGFLPPLFTLGELREAYEAILERKLDPANFRRQVEADGSLIATDEFRTGSHRPARLYRHNPTLELADRGPLERSQS